MSLKCGRPYVVQTYPPLPFDREPFSFETLDRQARAGLASDEEVADTWDRAPRPKSEAFIHLVEDWEPFTGSIKQVTYGSEQQVYHLEGALG